MSGFYEISEKSKGELVVHFNGRMDIESSTSILDELHSIIAQKSPASLAVDLDQVTYFDDFDITLSAK